MRFSKILVSVISFMYITNEPTYAHLNNEESTGIKRIQELTSVLNRERAHTGRWNLETMQAINEINSITSGKTARISQKYATSLERKHVLSSTLAMHFHASYFNIENLFNSFTYHQQHYGHMLSLLVMHVTAKTVVHDQSVHFLCDSDLQKMLEKNLIDSLHDLKDVSFKDYAKSIKNKHNFIRLSLGEYYRDVIKELSSPQIFKDVPKAWAVYLFSQFENQINYRKEGLKNQTLRYTEGGKVIIFSRLDPDKICEDYLEKHQINPDDFLRLEDRVAVYSDNSSNLLDDLERAYEEKRRKMPQQVPNWTKIFTLKNGLKIHRSPDWINFAGIMQSKNLSLGGNFNINGHQINNPLNLRLDMTEEEFVAALRRASLLD